MTYIFRLFAFLFSPFHIFLLQCLTFYWAASSLRNIPKHHWDGQSLPQSSQVYSGMKFCSEFFTQICEHFCAYFRLTVIWVSTHDHWKELFLLQNLSKSNVNVGQRWWHQQWNKGQCSWRPVTAGTGINGLNIDQPEETVISFSQLATGYFPHLYIHFTFTFSQEGTVTYQQSDWFLAQSQWRWETAQVKLSCWSIFMSTPVVIINLFFFYSSIDDKSMQVNLYSLLIQLSV